MAPRAYHRCVAVRTEPIAVSTPGLRALRWWSDEPHTRMKEAYTVARLVRGRSSFWSAGKVWESTPGSLQIKQPGDVHRDVSSDGPLLFQLVTFPTSLVESAVGKVRALPQLAPGDPRGAAFQHLHDAVARGAERLALDVAVVEAIAALGALDGPKEHYTRAVRRALELLRERLAEPLTLDEIAAHAELGKFYLCRAFRAQLGMPPHAYLTRLRIRRAKELLAAGTMPRDVAPLVGLYDQSQLNRHFRRLVGTTPGEYARRVGRAHSVA
ncbi:MAG: helix-turn-helix transcriptional regulator [Polyangiaceae bacterium]|nr:helix-turn-helix transcriptional regulator [Polyangiaceae bacterium]